jgi:ubiquinone/menaquinone biosynthesis C-methylase UbiE
MSQDEVFVSGEADAWFERNASAMHGWRDAAADPILRMLRRYGARPATVLEVGASNGYRLNWIQEAFGAQCTGIDPSAKAVEDGRSHYPGVKLDVGVASQLPYDSASFDCVVVCSVFHWLDRAALLQGIAETDRVLKDGGLLVLADFQPLAPERVHYHHREDVEVFTYKQDYAAIFRASNVYELLSAEVVDHATFAPRADLLPYERFGVSLLKKELSRGYLTRARPDAP